MLSVRHDNSLKQVVDDKSTGLDPDLNMHDERGLVGYYRDILGRFLACIIRQMMVPFSERKHYRKDKFGGIGHEFSLKYLRFALHFQ